MSAHFVYNRNGGTINGAAITGERAKHADKIPTRQKRSHEKAKAVAAAIRSGASRTDVLRDFRTSPVFYEWVRGEMDVGKL